MKDIKKWNKTLPIERLRGKVSFVPAEGNYGTFLQGSIKKILTSDFEAIENEHNLLIEYLLQKGLIQSRNEG